MNTARTVRAIAALGATAFALSAGSAFAAPTDVDTGFGKNGRTLIDAGGDESTAGIVIQPDGKAVGVGYTTAGAGQRPIDALAYRLNADGSLDQGFGTPTLDAGGTEIARDAAVQSDGKIVVAGDTTNNRDAVVYRLEADGTPDSGFGTGGMVTIDSGGIEHLYGVAIQPDGKVVAVGTTSVGNDVAVYRLTAEGKLDPTFDGDGARGIDSGGPDTGRAVAVQPDGKILVTGYASSHGLVVYRLSDDGSSDASFSGGAASIGAGNMFGYGLAIQPDGKVVAVAEVYGGKDNDVLVARFTADGKPDPTFNAEGSIEIDAGSDETPSAVAIQPDGKILIGGGVEAGNDALLVRLHGNGSRDQGFGENGIFTFGAGGLDDSARMALQPDGKILLADDNAATDTDALVYRFKGDSKDPNGGNGQQPGGNGQQPGGGAGRADTTAPVLSRVRLSRRRFRAGRAATALSAGIGRGTSLSFRSTEAGTLALTFERALPGRRSRSAPTKCRRVKTRPRRGACTVHRSAGALARTIGVGAGSVALSGRLGRRRMKPGTYRLRLVATDAAGNRSSPVRVDLTVVR